MCSEQTNKKIIPVDENGRKFTLINEQTKKVTKIKVDGCLIDDARERCDYVFEIDIPCSLVIYLELKGKDITKAYSQLVATLRYLSSKHRKCKRECYIVASRVPRSTTSVQVLKARLLKSHKVQLFVKTTQAEITI